jgi:hypothetical protein
MNLHFGSSNTTYAATNDLVHLWQEVHHYDDAGKHYCPTHYEMCNHCLTIRWTDTPHCHRWGE